MNRFLLIVWAACASSVSLWAQDTNVTGKVTTAQGEALPGVNVLLKGTTVGAITDAEGTYRIAARDGVLVFSFIGYTTQEVDIGGRTTVDVTMEEDITTLEQVVVVGYGTQERKDITGAVSVVGTEVFEGRPNTQFGNMMQGKVAGVQVISPSGKPSVGFSMRVRGTNSISGSSEPLYVVDGTPVSDTRTINPADIESISVLKDASSAAIYGAQGASNGVVLITTKKGTTGAPRFEFNSYVGYASAWNTLDVLNAEQYRDLMTELGQNTDWSLYTENTDWQKEIFQRGRSQNYQLSVSGKTETSQYYISAGWMQQEGSVRSSEMDRYNFKVSLEQEVNNWLLFGTNINYMRYHDVDVSDNQAINQGGVILGMLSTPPNIGIYRPNGTFTSNPFQDWENPVAATDGSDRGYYNNRVLGNVYAEISILQDLKLRSNLGIDFNSDVYDYFLDPFRTSYGRAKKGIGQNRTHFNNYFIVDNTLTYQRNFDEKHNLLAMVGSIVQEYRWEENYIETNGFSGTGVPTTNAGSIIVQANNRKSERANASFIARVNYDYLDKYLFTANFRADGSSKFGANNRWGYFPSFSLGWRLSEEQFLQSLSFLDDLKVRVGYGINGNDQTFSSYPFVGVVSPGANYPIGGVIQPGNYQSTIENQDLKWEQTEQTNIGVDVALWNSRVIFTADAYIKKTSDLLLELPVPRSTGFDVGIQNVGELENRGLEFAVTSRNLTGELTWDTDFNITFNRNKLVNVVGQQIVSGGVAGRGDVSYSVEGKPIGLFYGYVSGGVDPATGDVYYVAQNGEGTFTPATTDRTFIGNPNPDFIYGMTNTLGYKNFNLSIFLQGSQGNDIFNATRIETEGMTDAKNQSAVVNNRWRAPGDVTEVPRAVWGVTNNSRISSRFVEDGSYMRVKAITLGYTLPTSIASKAHLTNVRFYVTGENLFTFTDYSGYDPEVSAFGTDQDTRVRNTALGVDYGTYPQTRNLIFGLNVTF